jgi:hypothetical protein
MNRIANKAARAMVEARRPFEGSNLFAREHVPPHGHTTLYVVYSYGEHFPIYIAETDNETKRLTWYANSDKYSPSTSRHQSQAAPWHGTYCVPMTTDAMRRIAKDGIAGLVVKGEMQ